MFSAHPTTDPGIIFSPKPTKKHTSELTLKIDNLKPRKNKKLVKNRLPTGSPKSIKNQKKSNPGAQTVTFGAPSDPSTTNERSKVQKNRSQCPKMGPQNLKKRSISAVNLFNESSISTINLFNKHAYQQSTYQQVTEGAGGRGEALRYELGPGPGNQLCLYHRATLLCYQAS